MKKSADTQLIASLILKEKCQLISSQEQNVLDEWLLADSKNVEIYKYIQENNFYNSYETFNTINTSQALKKYKSKYNFRKKYSLLKWSISSVASLVIIFFGYILFIQYENSVATSTINAGSPKALLVLSDGKRVDLESVTEVAKIVDGANVIKNSEHTLNYQGQDKSTKENVFNELIIPLGGEYKIELSDGTIVWMNSMSKLRFPVVFGSGERVVFLEGEAYFDVAKDSLRPFNVVINSDLKVRVLGTAFNVRAYADEPNVETVLEEGAVVVNSKGSDVILRPNQKASYNNHTKSVSVGDVDTRNYTSWRNGHFVFNEMSIEKILNYISRWYSFEVEYQNESVKHIIFSGSLKKYEDITKFLSAIELAGGAKFEISNNKLIITK